MGNVDVVHELLRHGARRDEQTNNVTPLAIAMKNGHRDVVKVLTASGSASGSFIKPTPRKSVGY